MRIATAFGLGLGMALGPAGLLWADSPPLRIEPAIPTVPANHLKFYLHFDQPMERGDVFPHLRLVEIDEHGTERAEVPEPFREVELWDATFTRLTLWFHPGRQKPGVNLNVDIGPILEPGKRYRLEVDGRWRTEQGRTLGRTFRHEFAAADPDERSPTPSNWILHYPREEDTQQANEVRFPPGSIVLVTREYLDPVSAVSAISVQRDGQEVPVRATAGTGWTSQVALDPSHLHLVLLPDADEGDTPAPSAWKPGDYRISLDPRLEDLAGNSLARPFNLDLEKHPDFKERTEPVVIPFSIPEDSPGKAP